MVLESGGQVTRTVGVEEGLVVKRAVRQPSYAGDDLTEFLTRLLADQGHAMPSATEREVMRDIKEKLGYVSEELSLETVKFLGERERRVERGRGIERGYELPDGQFPRRCSRRVGWGWMTGHFPYSCATRFTPAVLI